MEKGKLVPRVEGNEIEFKFPFISSPSTVVQETVWMINLGDNEASVHVQRKVTKGKERPEKHEEGRRLPSKVKAKYM